MQRDSNKVWNIVDDDINAFNEQQYKKMYRSTDFLINCLKLELQAGEPLSILDIGCGGGANLSYIARSFPNYEFTGVDINKHYIQMAKNMHSKSLIKNTQFCCTDFTKMEFVHDIIGSSQLLNIIDKSKGKELLELSFLNANKAVFIFSIFSERLLDYEITIKDHYYNKEIPYNIYSILRIAQFALQMDYKLKHKIIFNMDIELPNIHRGRGTYTIQTAEGKNLMFTDVLHLPWYFLYFEKNNLDENKQND